MSISRETIERIKSHADIVEVVSDYLTLKRRGSSLTACCPFHNEKSPSFHVNPRLGIYKCFGCGKSGDGISFVMEYDKLTYPEALRQLAQKYQIEIEEDKLSVQQKENFSERESLLIVLNYAKNYYQQILFEHSEGKSLGLSYFKERGFSEKTIKAFELGYSLDTWEGFLTEAKANQYSIELLEKAGLIKPREEGKEGHYDRFRGRVIFPIHNPQGKVIAFGARILKSDKESAKYLNSPETEVYHKSNVLYGMFQAKNAIRTEENCFLVEGYTDVVSMYQAGIENVVASSGTSLTHEQSRLIRRYTENVTVLYDGDPAGIKASLRGIEILLEEGLNVRVALFPDKEDPDSFVKKVGVVAFKEFISANTKDFVTFKASLFLDELKKDPLRKAEIAKDLVESISKIPDVLKRSVMVQETANLIGLSEAALLDELNRVLVKKKKPVIFERQSTEEKQEIGYQTLEESFNEQSETITVDKAEMEIIRILIMHAGTKINDDLRVENYLLAELEEVEFKTPIFLKIMEQTKSFASENYFGRDFFLTHDDSEIRQQASDILSKVSETSPNWERFSIFIPKKDEELATVAYDAVLRLKGQRLQEMEIEAKKGLASDDPEEQEKAIKLYMAIKTESQKIDKEKGTVVRKN
ncbi:MAG: DNA primase [Opitutaceae bacterium]|nr:DNA primase [Cytophagales bacterium]